MTATATTTARPGGLAFLWQRRLDRYPTGGARYSRLVLAVLATVAIYYEQYTLGAVSTLVQTQLHMSFLFLLTALGIANLLGAFGSLAAGLADRLGRANIVVYGMLVVGVVTAFGVTAAHDKWTFIILSTIVGIMEGMLLVATPALVRDFSPQMGRARAMGFWNVAPPAGSLLASAVAAMTLGHLVSWQSQFVISGSVGIVVSIVALFFLKELSPELRDQAAVNEEDRELLEARAASGKVEVNVEHPWRQLMHADVIVPAAGFSIALLFYYTMVGFAPVLFTTVWHLSLAASNSVVAWAWGFNVLVSLTYGSLVDKFRVRKPWILGSAIVCAIVQVYLLTLVGTNASYLQIAIVMVVLAASWGGFAVPWYAAYTETVEARNPALTATGLAIWAWIVRFVVFISFLAVPHVVSSANTLVNSAPYIAAAQKAKAAGQPVSGALARNLADIQHAAVATIGQWQVWMGIAVACAVFLALTVPLLRGPWSPARARAQQEEHNRRRDAEIAELRAK
ncbi:MAG: MFS transporter [Actinomycetia bacterium]|jgi:MFS family permease|nr:MFS transporter [Actinomycetes bacterium]